MKPASEFYKLAPQLVVSDVVKTAEYYRDVFGFKILGYWHDPPVFAIIGRGAVEIQLGLADTTNIVQNSNLAQRKNGLDIYIRVSNINSLLIEIKSKGAKIVEPLCEREYKMIEFAVEDCNGFKLVFGQDTSR